MKFKKIGLEKYHVSIVETMQFILSMIIDEERRRKRHGNTNSI